METELIETVQVREKGVRRHFKELGASWQFVKYGVFRALFPLVRILYLILRKRSLKTRFKVIRALLFFIYWLWAGRRVRTTKNLALIRPDLDEREIAKGSWRVIETVARSWAALIGNEYISVDEVMAKLEVKGIEPLLEYHRRGKKIIVVADHVGPFDEMVGIIPFFGLRIYVPSEPIKPGWLLKLMMSLRLQFGDILFEPVAKGKALARSAHQLADGRIVLLMVDVVRYDRSGVVCRVGRAKGRFPVGAVKLALEQEAAIFPCFPTWGQDGQIKVTLGLPFELIKSGNMSRDIEANTRRLIEEVYAPHIQEHWDSWVRALWSRLEPVEPFIKR